MILVTGQPLFLANDRSVHVRWHPDGAIITVTETTHEPNPVSEYPLAPDTEMLAEAAPTTTRYRFMEYRDCDLCVGDCRSHRLGYDEDWIPERWSRAWWRNKLSFLRRRPAQ